MLLAQLSSQQDIETEHPVHEPDTIPETIKEFDHSEGCKSIKKVKVTSQAVFKPLLPLPCNNYSFNNGSCELPMVSITFDGGSLANAAMNILDTLNSRNVKTTMFLTGQFIRKHPEIVQKIVDHGHELGNHTLNHPRLTSFSENRLQRTLAPVTQSVIFKELISADRLLASTTGIHFAPLWRAPYGEYNEQLCKWARDAGYMHVGWRQGRSWKDGFDTNDWITDSETPGFKTPDEVFTKIVTLANTKPYGINGGIILMHLGTLRKNRSEQVHFKLGVLIDSLRVLGYEIVPVSEMMRRSGVNVNAGQTVSKDPIESEYLKGIDN